MCITDFDTTLAKRRMQCVSTKTLKFYTIELVIECNKNM